MKRLLSIALLLGMLLQTYSALVIYAGYEMNKEYITQKFCENKDKPMMHCNGMCHMAKEIKKNAGDESKRQNSVRVFAEEFITISPEKAKHLSDNLPIVITTVNFPYMNNYSFTLATAIFHPPLV